MLYPLNQARLHCLALSSESKDGPGRGKSWKDAELAGSGLLSCVQPSCRRLEPQAGHTGPLTVALHHPMVHLLIAYVSRIWQIFAIRSGFSVIEK